MIGTIISFSEIFIVNKYIYIEILNKLIKKYFDVYLISKIIVANIVLLISIQNDRK